MEENNPSLRRNSTPTEDLFAMCKNINSYSPENAIRTLTQILSAGADINGTENVGREVYTPLFLLCNYGAHPSIIKFVLDKGANPNQFAGFDSEWTVLSYLADDINTPILYRSDEGMEKLSEYKHTILQLLLDTPSLNPNILDLLGNTICYDLLATYPGLVYYIIENRHPSLANLNNLNGPSKRTILILSCRALIVIKEKLHRHTEANKHNKNDFYPHRMINLMRLHTQIVTKLAELDGIDLNIIDTENKTALDYIDDGLPEAYLLESQRSKNSTVGILAYVKERLRQNGALTYQEIEMSKTPVHPSFLRKNNNNI